jgi:uncharacterized membrane protein
MNLAISPSRRLSVAAAFLGFALGGFFDGILLHQILQWHHLLSGLPQAADDLRFLVLTDGLFHLAMYLVAAFGLWWLWTARAVLAEQGHGRAVFAFGMVGFGTWHVIDAFVSHWLLGIHRIRMDSEMPLLWDLLWLGIFGLVPIIIGLWSRRSGDGTGTGRPAALLLVLLTVLSGAAQAFPPPTGEPVVVLFRQGLAETDVMAAIEAVDGRLAGRDPTGTLWAVDLPQAASAAALYGRGALFVSGAWLPAGCLDYTRVGEA